MRRTLEVKLNVGKAIVDHAGAPDAYETLVKAGADSHVLDGYLQRVGGFRDVRVGPFRAPRSLARKLRLWPKRLERMAEELDELCKASLMGDLLRGPAEPLRVANTVRGWAKEFRQTKVISRHRKANRHRDSIIDLMYYVKESTGRWHDEEVCVLVNAMLASQGSQKNHDVPGLRMLRKRYLAQEASAVSRPGR